MLKGTVTDGNSFYTSIICFERIGNHNKISNPLILKLTKDKINKVATVYGSYEIDMKNYTIEEFLTTNPVWIELYNNKI